MPSRVMDAPCEVAAFGLSALVMTGTSNVKEFVVVPTIAVTVTLKCFCFWLQVDQWYGPWNLMAVAEVHDTDGAHLPATVADPVISWCPKERPCIVIDVSPHVGPFNGAWNETTGASKVKIIEFVPT